jgi:CBS domain-containing protein
MEERVLQRMRRGAITCTEDTSIREVSQIMVVNRSRYCVVVNDRNEVTGIISARSILKAFGRDLDETKARDILLPHTVTITPRSPLEEAIGMMARKRIEHLVVVSDRPGSKAVLGILPAAELVRHMATS